MKLLLVTRMLPSLGGLETMARVMAIEWQKNPALELRILTDCKGDEVDGVKVPIWRKPTLNRMADAYRWADVVFFNHCYVRLALPLLWMRIPYVVSMSGAIPDADGASADWFKVRLLRRLLRNADANIVACDAMRRHNRVPATLITNPFDSVLFKPDTISRERNYDFLFGGRICEAKGCYDMIRALEILRKRDSLRPSLSIAGDGDERDAVLNLAESLGVREQIRYLGTLAGPELATALREHRCILVPSRYEEPIGIMCLEGIACGCVAIGSNGGGLGESVGPCGFTFPNGDVEALADRMRQVLALSEGELEGFRAAAPAHLEKYAPAKVCEQYLEVAKAALAKHKP